MWKGQLGTDVGSIWAAEGHKGPDLWVLVIAVRKCSGNVVKNIPIIHFQ